MSGDNHSLLGSLGADDHTIYILADGTRAFSGPQAMGANQITGLADGSLADDAATVGQVNAATAGLSVKESVVAASYTGDTAWATTADLDYQTATDDLVMTAMEAGSSAPTFDGVEVVVGSRILIKDASTAFAVKTNGGAEGTPAKYDGIWEVTATPTAASCTAQRPDDFEDASVQDNNTFVWVEQGSINGDQAFVQTADAVTVNTTAQSWTNFTASVTAHSGLTGLTSGDDHTQYAYLAGRSGGQTMVGDTVSGGDLLLSSTAHATKGIVGPTADNTQDFGASGARWANGYFAICTVGDQLYANKWGWTEDYTNNGMVMYDDNKEAVMAIYGDGIYYREYGWRRAKKMFGRGKQIVPVYEASIPKNA